MKHLFAIFTFLFLISCSGSDSPEETQIQTENPTIQSTSVSAATAGDTVIINGQNFNSNATYTISFNGVNAQIKQITATTVSVIVPTGATSGPIKLTANGSVINVGTITINLPNRLFAYKKYAGIIEINPSTGAEIGTIINTGSEYISNLKYFAPTNQIIGQKSISGSNGSLTYKLYKIKLSDKTITETTFTGYEDLIVTTTGKLYGYKAYTGIIELNPATGAEIGTIINTGSEYLSNLVYYPKTNQIIGEKEVLNSNRDLITKLYKINLSDRVITQVNFYGYEKLIVTTSGKLYGYQKAFTGVIELNPTTGEEIGDTIVINPTYISNFFYYPQTNQLIGQRTVTDFNGNNTYKLYKINLSNKTNSEVNLKEYEEFIVTN